MMYAYANLKPPARARKTTAVQVVRTVLWSVALPPLVGAILVGGVAALAGLPPLDFALNFLGQVFIDLSGVIANLCIAIFFAAALYYGVSPRLPGLLLHRSLTAGSPGRLCAAPVP